MSFAYHSLWHPPTYSLPPPLPRERTDCPCSCSALPRGKVHFTPPGPHMCHAKVRALCKKFQMCVASGFSTKDDLQHHRTNTTPIQTAAQSADCWDPCRYKRAASLCFPVPCW